MKERTLYQWYILHIKLGHEQKVSCVLRRKQLEHYCLPMTTKQYAVTSGENVCDPLPSSYILIYVHHSLLVQALKIKGVLNCMYWLSSPAVVSAEEMLAIRQSVNKGALQLQQFKIGVPGTKGPRPCDKNLHGDRSQEGIASQAYAGIPSYGSCLTGETTSATGLAYPEEADHAILFL